MDYLAVMDLKRENPVQLPTKFTAKEGLSIPKNVSTPELAHRWKHLRSKAKHMTPRLLNVRIGLLISSNCRNRRIRK